MNLNFAIVRTILRTELRMLLRDRRTVLMSILVPLLITPLMLLATSGMQRARAKTLDETVYQYVVTGTEAHAARAVIAAATARNHEETKEENERGAFRSEEMMVRDPTAALDDRRIHFYVEALTPDEARAERNLAQNPDGAEAEFASTAAEAEKEPEEVEVNWREPLVAAAPVIRLVYRADRDDSQSGMRRMRGALQEHRRETRDALLVGLNFPATSQRVARVEEKNLASEGQVAGLAFGRVVTLFVLIFIMSGCAVAATDSIAGEKERGTLETLLTTAATRLEIVIAKHLAVLAVAFGIALVQAGNLFIYVGLKLIPVPANFAAALPAGVILLLLAMFLPLAALAASVLLLASGYAKSYKESQLYFTPIFLVGGLLAVAPFLPGLSLRSAIVLLPVANLAVGAREILTGTFDWPMLTGAWVITAAAAAWATRLSVRMLGTEKLITATESDEVDFVGGPALFRRVVLRWFVVMWALLLILSNYAAAADLRVQVTLNLVGLFLGASLLMLRRYRLDTRSALSLRLPRGPVWLAVAAAVPSAILAGMGILYLSQFLFPVSPDFMREMTEAFRVDHIPTWQLVFFIGLLPGIIEEITFRGLLLHGLHRRMHPALLVLVVGLVFGIFHVTLPRIIPTAFLGLLFTITVLLTGSIYPAMLWHAANNIIMVLLGDRLLPVLEARPAWYASGSVALLLCFLVIWRYRTPYPGLRPWKRERAMRGVA